MALEVNHAMDPAVAWFQEEQEGPAKRIWLGIWETASEIEAPPQTPSQAVPITNSNLDHKANIENTSQNNYNPEKNFNPARRKAGSTLDNKASTYNMNKYQSRLVGKNGGCPWRPHNFQYGRGIIG